VLSHFIVEFLDDSYDDDDRDDDESGGIRRACSLSDLNALSGSNPSSSNPTRRKRSFHRHRNNGFDTLINP